MDVIFHGQTDERITLIDVSYVTGLGFNLYSLHAVQRTHLIVSDASGTHIIGTILTFPRSSSSDNILRATRLPVGDCRSKKNAARRTRNKPFKVLAIFPSISAFARRHLALLGSTMDHSDSDCANKTAEDYLRPHANICVHHRVIFCTSRRSASSRTGGDATAHIIIETPGSDSLAR